MATCQERNQMANLEPRPERGPFTDTFIKSRMECPHCYELCVVALSKNSKEMLIECEPFTKRNRERVGWRLSLIQHEGKTRLRADFLNPFDQDYDFTRGKRVWKAHWSQKNPACKEAWDERKAS